MRYLSLLGFATLLTFSCETRQEVQQAPPEIKVVEVITQDVQLEKDFVGQVYGKVDIPIRARVEGYLEGIHFKEGRPVKAGQLLYTIDAQPFRAAVAAAQSKLAEAEIELVRAQNDLNRLQPLAENNAISQRDLDAAIAAKGAAETAVNAAKANLRIENIRLGYTQIKSPISGIIGKTDARIGEFVGREPNPVILNTVSRIDSLRVEFFLTESDYLKVFREHLSKPVETRASEALDLKLLLADGSLFDQFGTVDFLNRQVDPTTGSILVQATFPNPDQLVRPGQFARVRAAMEEIKNAALVPQRCVTEFQGRFNLMLVDNENTVQQQSVEIAGSYRDYYLVSSGVKPGDLVVLEGLQQISTGMKINPQVVKFESRTPEQPSI